VPPCSASSLIQAVSSTVQSHRPLKRRVSALAPSLRTSLDGTDDGGGISESSSQRLRTPQATPPSRSVYRAGGVPVTAQNPMVDPAARQRRTRPPPFGCLLGVVMFAPPLSVESPAGKFMLTSVGRSLMECFAE